MSEEAKLEPVYGIDLGTTYSEIALFDPVAKQAKTFPSAEGQKTFPSVVMFNNDGTVTVGQVAKDGVASPDDAERVCMLVKRQMGKAGWTFSVDGKEWNAEAISAQILKKLAADASMSSGIPVKDVIITCPAYFNDDERKATKNAGIIAGLNVLQIIDEPVAAAFKFGFGEEGNSNVLVYDLGGGTFDVTAVNCNNGSVQVVCTDGNHELGGADWDRCVIDYVKTKWMEDHPETPADAFDQPETEYKMKIAAENLKKGLSQKQENTFRGVNVGGGSIRIAITREKFDEITKTKLDETIGYTKKVLDSAPNKAVEKGIYSSKEDFKISKILLVGGSTRMPQIAERLKQEFPENEIVQKLEDADEAVALGASVFGFIKSVQILPTPSKPDDESQGGEALPVLPSGVDPSLIKTAINTKFKTLATKSYGIRSLNKERQLVVTNLVKRQATVPLTGSQRFGTEAENQRSALIEVLENSVDKDEIPYVDPTQENSGLVKKGEAELHLPEGLPAGYPIEVTFSLSEEGLLKITATVTGPDGKPVSVDVEVKEAGLSKEEVEKLKEEAKGIVQV